MPTAALTLKGQGEISSLAQNTLSLPTHSYLTLYLHLSSYKKPHGELKGAAVAMDSHHSFGDLE